MSATKILGSGDVAATIALSLTPARLACLLHIDQHEPSPGVYKTHNRRVSISWLDTHELVAVTRDGTRLVSTHLGRRVADYVRAMEAA